MSNQVKNAIDAGLCGLCVTEGDVTAILQRVRNEAPPRRTADRTSGKTNWRLSIALALVMLMLVAAVGLRLTALGPTDMTPLQQPDAQATETPEGFVPVEEGEAEPVINISAAQAIAFAENHVYDQHDQTVDLRDGAAYEIGCDYSGTETENGVTYRNFYAVRFRALTVEGTEYTLRVSAADGSILSCEVQRGVGVNHTAEEIFIGYARIYGSDRRLWTQDQLRTYCLSLKKAAAGSLRWEDYLYMLSSYPDVAENAMTRDEVIAAVTDDLDILIFNYDQTQSDQSRWADAELLGDMRVRYISAYPNPVWKVAVDQRVVNHDGYETVRTVLIEVDSITGEVKHVEAVEASYAFQYESFTHSTIDALKATTTSGADPMLSDEQYRAIAAGYVRERWGEERDINDGALFTCTEISEVPALIQCDRRLVYRSVGGDETTVYVLGIDWYGSVIAANRSVTPAGGSDFTPLTFDLDWRMEALLECQAKAAASAQANEPEVRVFTGTVWLDDSAEGTPNAVYNAALEAVGAKNTTRVNSVLISAAPNPVCKVAMESDQGVFFVEVDSVTCDVISVQRVNNLYETWYLPFVLTADLEAAGVPIAPDVQPVFLTEATDDHGTNDGMRVDHLYMRFKQLYGPNMGLWTPAQLRSFQRMVVLSSDYDYDMAVICLRNTVYPDVPANAISREEAAEIAVRTIDSGASLGDGWELCGAVLIGTKEGSLLNGTPVWKVCVYQQDGSFWYAEVNCMTGKLLRLHQDADGAASPGASYDYGTPQNLWFRDIVLEDTIEDCDVIWDSRGNG